MQVQYVQTYDYDALNRRKRVTESASWKQEYTYDRWGNRKIHQTNTVRVRNASGNYLDEFGNVAKPSQTHDIGVVSK